jgi:hypothetical protein
MAVLTFEIRVSDTMERDKSLMLLKIGCVLLTSDLYPTFLQPLAISGVCSPILIAQKICPADLETSRMEESLAIIKVKY